jgi:hypothetical protein
MVRWWREDRTGARPRCRPSCESAAARAAARARAFCWVQGPEQKPGPWPGVIARWVRQDDGWTAVVVCIITDAEGEWPRRQQGAARPVAASSLGPLTMTARGSCRGPRWVAAGSRMVELPEAPFAGDLGRRAVQLAADPTQPDTRADTLAWAGEGGGARYAAAKQTRPRVVVHSLRSAPAGAIAGLSAEDPAPYGSASGLRAAAGALQTWSSTALIGEHAELVARPAPPPRFLLR